MFAELYDQHVDALYRYASGRAGPAAADDLVSETFLAAFQHWERFDSSRGEARAWLFGILTRKISRHHRQEKVHLRAMSRMLAEPAVQGVAEQAVESAGARAARTTLIAAVARLSKRDRNVLLLIAFGELSYQEVADALEIPVGTVRSRLNRVRRQIRSAFGDEDPTRIVEETR